MKRGIIVASVLIACLCLSRICMGPAQGAQSERQSQVGENDLTSIPSPISPQGHPIAKRLINHRSDTNIRITLTPEKPVYRPEEPISLVVEANRDSYLTLLYVSPSGKVLVIWPNGSDSLDQKVRAHQALRLPDSGARFKFVADGSSPYERIVAVACTEENLLLRQQDFRMSPGSPVRSSSVTVEDLLTTILERTKRVPSRVSWGTAEQTIGVASHSTGATVSTVDSQHERQELERVHHGEAVDTRREKPMWIGGYYVAKHRQCRNKDLRFTRPEVIGWLKGAPRPLKVNFSHGDEQVLASDFQKNSNYHSSPRCPNGFDGLDSVHIAIASSHGGFPQGVYCLCVGGKGGCTVFSNSMSLGQNNLRYLFWQTCHSLELPKPYATWFPAAKGIRAIFGFHGASADTDKYGKYFWQNLKKYRKCGITNAFLNASQRAGRNNTPVALWFGPDQKTAVAMCDHETEFHLEPVQAHDAAWRYDRVQSLHRRKDVSLVPAASVLFKPAEEHSELPSLVEKLGLVEKGSFQLIDKESNEDTTTYYSHDDGPTLVVNRSSGAFELILPEFETKGSVEYGDEEAIDIASRYCKKIETQLKGLSLERKDLDTELRPCEIRHTFVGSTSDSGVEPEKKLTQTCVVFRPIMNGLPTIGTGGVLEVTLNAAKEVSRVRSVLREVASVQHEKSTFDAHSLERAAKRRALDDVRQMTGDEDCKVKSVELGYFADDEAEIQKVSRPSFEVVVESGTEPYTKLYEKVYDLQELERERNN